MLDDRYGLPVSSLFISPASQSYPFALEFDPRLLNPLPLVHVVEEIYRCGVDTRPGIPTEVIVAIPA
jgi:hypothetical protein